jgi:hypothetical protein
MTDTVRSAWDMACPECGRDDEIDIRADVWIRLCPDGTDPAASSNGDHEWGDYHPALCNACGCQRTVADFIIDETPEDRDNG